jgi:hypothetical protein
MDESTWVFSQTLHDALFVHWPVRPPELPEGLEVDRCEGTAWMGLVAFRVTDFRARRLLPVPGLSEFVQLNLRTYVRCRGEPGVWFLSLDVSRRALMAAGRRWWRLPYYLARLQSMRVGDGIEFIHRRTHLGAPPASFAADVHPNGPPEPPAPGSLDHFLTERYRLYTADGRGRLMSAGISHAPWPLQPAAGRVQGDALPRGAHVRLSFARRQELKAGPLRRLI